MRIILTVACLMIAVPALAADDAWRGTATVYLWASAIDSEVNFPGPAGSRDLSLSAGDVIENLKFAFMGAGTLRKGRVGMFGDVVYANIGDGVEGTREFELGDLPPSANVTANLDLDAKTWLFTLGGSYALVDTPDLTLDVTAGARLFDMRQTLDFRLTGAVGGLPPQEVAGRRSADVSNWDFVAGMSGRYRFGKDRQWFVPVRFDIGTGESDLTWQALAGVGHAFGWGDVTVAYRRIDYELDGAVEDFSMHGPVLGATFRF